MKIKVIELTHTDQAAIKTMRDKAKAARAEHQIASTQIGEKCMHIVMGDGIEKSNIKRAELSDDGRFVIAHVYEPGEQRKQNGGQKQ